jgi:glycosyltransferase involved in cell wall biosynthesis
MKKLAVSFSEMGHVYLVGFSNFNTPKTQFVTFGYKNSSVWRRLLELAKFLRKVKPDLLVVQHPLLLVFSLWFPTVYDVQENYRLNFLFNPAYSSPSKYLLAWAVGIWERFFGLFVKKFLYAEEIYASQLKFRPYSILENKFEGSQSQFQAASERVFLLCGTISRLFGLEEAFAFFERAELRFPESRLRVLGHLVEPQLLGKLKEKASQNPKISLEVSLEPLPHGLILQAMAQSWFVLLPHLPNPCIQDKIPTKVFECLAMQKPMLAQRGHRFAELIEKNRAGLALDWSELESNFPNLEQSFYTQPLSLNPFWEKQELLKAIEGLY